MSTSCVIAKRTASGKITAIYCDSLQTVQGICNELVLYRCYSDPKVLTRLLNLGNLQCLGKDPDALGDVYGNSGDMCISYHRDLHEKIIRNKMHSDKELVDFARAGFASSIYLYEMYDHCWYMKDVIYDPECYHTIENYLKEQMMLPKGEIEHENERRSAEVR
jgi:hypothetical protein